MAESGQELPRAKSEPADEAAEVVAKGGVGGIAAAEPEIVVVAALAMLGLEMADDGLDGGPAAEFTLDRGRYPSLLAGEKHLV